MTTFPLVTIAIPTYNRATSYLPQALESALRQTYQNIEIIVSDNCSTDHTRALVTGIIDPRVRYFRHEPGIGQKGNYNFCVKQAQGSYMLLLHDDDVIDEEFVSSCIEAATGAPDVGVILTGLKLIDTDGQVISHINNELTGGGIEALFHAWFSGKTPIYCCNTLFNTERLRQIGGFSSKHFLYADTFAMFRLAAYYGRIDVREVKASFRIHGAEGGFARKIGDWCEDSLELLRLMCDLVPENSKDWVRNEGIRFFANANYGRATAADSPWARLIAIMKVMRYFKYRQLPSVYLLIHSLRGTRLYDVLRFIKRRALSGSVLAKRKEQSA